MNLPESAREELRRAAQTAGSDPNARSKAIDRVTEQLRVKYPECFKESDHVSDDENGPGERIRSPGGARPPKGSPE